MTRIIGNNGFLTEGILFQQRNRLRKRSVDNASGDGVVSMQFHFPALFQDSSYLREGLEFIDTGGGEVHHDAEDHQEGEDLRLLFPTLPRYHSQHNSQQTAAE